MPAIVYAQFDVKNGKAELSKPYFFGLFSDFAEACEAASDAADKGSGAYRVEGASGHPKYGSPGEYKFRVFESVDFTARIGAEPRVLGRWIVYDVPFGVEFPRT